ncbi:MAG: helix-turn-helix domain-containing protein [bacterium]
MIKNAFELRTIGTLLKERRKERGLSIEEVAQITKIRGRYLEALEDSNYSIFPSEVYIKGFLKNYAKLLKINEERALAMYRREREYQLKTPTISTTEKIKGKGFNFQFTPQRIITGVVIIIVLLTVYYIGSYTGKILKAPTLSISKPVILQAGGSSNYEAYGNSLDIAGKVEPGATLTINGQRYETNNFEAFFTTLNLKEGRNDFTIVAESQFGKKSTMNLTVISQSTDQNIEQPSVTPTLEITPISEFTVNIKIINKEAYLSIIVDGVQKAKQTYPIGQNLTFQASQTIKLYSPRPDAIDATIDGKKYPMTSIKTYTWSLNNGIIMFE